MLATNLLFIDTWPGHLLPTPRHSPRNSPRNCPGAASADSQLERATAADACRMAAAAAHIIIQLALPLRPLIVSRFDPIDVVHTKVHEISADSLGAHGLGHRVP